MNITMENFKTAKYDVFSIFDDRWGLCTAGTPREYNTMTIGWGTMGIHYIKMAISIICIWARLKMSLA